MNFSPRGHRKENRAGLVHRPRAAGATAAQKAHVCPSISPQLPPATQRGASQRKQGRTPICPVLFFPLNIHFTSPPCVTSSHTGPLLYPLFFTLAVSLKERYVLSAFQICINGLLHTSCPNFFLSLNVMLLQYIHLDTHKSCSFTLIEVVTSIVGICQMLAIPSWMEITIIC